MRRPRWTPLAFAVVLLAIGIGLHGQPPEVREPASQNDRASAPGERAAPDPRDVVVMIHVKASSKSEYGAGILLSQTPSETLVVTAAHVVADALAAGNTAVIDVRFRNAPGKAWLAEVVEHAVSIKPDVAVIRIRQAVPLLLTDTRRAVLPHPEEPSGGGGRRARIIGNMNDRAWSQSAQPEPIALISNDVLTVKSQAIDSGASGGGVFSEHGSLLGLTYFSDGDMARAVPVALVLDLLKTWKIDAGWTVNNGALASAALLRLREGKLLRAASIAEALMNNDAIILNDIGLASRRLDVTLLDRAMRAPVPGERTRTALEEYFVQAKADPQSDYRWLTQLGAAGLDLNLRIAHPYYGEESILIAALRSANSDGVAALLKGGASPHGYQRLQGTTDQYPRFLYPLGRSGNERGRSDQLAQAFIDAGMITPATSPTFDESPADRICTAAMLRSGFDWCGFTRQLPTGVQFAGGGGDYYDPVDGTGVARLRQLLHISNDTAYFAGAFPSRGRSEPGDADIVAEIPRNGSAWFVYRYSPFGRPTRNCKPDAAGREGRQCWERLKAWPYNVLASWRATETPSPQPTAAIDALRRFEIDGLSLGMSTEAAHTLLSSRGYKPQTKAAGAREYSVRFSYARQEQGDLRIINFHALGPEILLIDARLLGARAVPPSDAELAKEMALVEPLIRQREQFTRLDVNDLRTTRGALIVNADAEGGGRRIQLNFSATADSQRLVSVQRRSQGTTSERAFFDNLWEFITDVR